MDIIKYTDVEIAKNLVLLENHLKQSPSTDEFFCKDCINKHRILLIGLAEEGMTAGGDADKYKKINNFMNLLKNKDYKKEGIQLSYNARMLRKDYFSDECPDCSDSIKKLAKDLNNELTYDNYNLNLNKKPMAKYKDLAVMNAGQFAAEGVRYLAGTNATLIPYEKYVTIGGGIALQVLGVYIKKGELLKKVLLVSGSNLLAGGVVKLVTGMTTPTIAARANAVRANNAGVRGYAGKAYSYAPVSGGPTFAGKVTATNIPSQYARAGILSSAQAFERPEHADLIRVD